MKHKKKLKLKIFAIHVGTFRKTYFEVSHPLPEVVLDPRDVIVPPPNLKSSVS
jgi:hypothetical protein